MTKDYSTVFHIAGSTIGWSKEIAYSENQKQTNNKMNTNQNQPIKTHKKISKTKQNPNKPSQKAKQTKKSQIKQKIPPPKKPHQNKKQPKKLLRRRNKRCKTILLIFLFLFC